jgi:glucose/arabinose dehydrogenase
MDQLWLGVQPSPADFSGRFKVTWDANKLYILAEITDDVLSDYHSDPLSNYWEDDTWEIFLDENASGGIHEFSYNAFAYHISKSFDIADMGPDRNAGLYNHHAQVARTNIGTDYIWEAAFDVYNDQYVFGATNNPKVTLTAGKIMGFAMAYCDNDGGSTRQSFIGSEVVEGSNKNVAYIDANVFGKMELVESVTPQFTHVRVATGLINPTAFTIAKDGRIFVCEQTGKVRVIENGQLLSEPALSITVNTSGPEGYTERGLLGITLDPDFENNNYFYIFYTAPTTPTNSRVVRYTLNGNIADPGSASIVINLDPLSDAHNHNGGGLHFGTDGKLYIATGENATPSNAQNLDNTHGKILRLNPDGSIPTGNPFTTGSTQKQMIWTYGLRNPFTFDIQKSTGKIYVNDVGQTKFEEINDVTTSGLNFGWPTEEGNGSVYTNPVYTYANNSLTSGKECAITGGCFFEPTATNYPAKYKGKYFFMD